MIPNRRFVAAFFVMVALAMMAYPVSAQSITTSAVGAKNDTASNNCYVVTVVDADLTKTIPPFALIGFITKRFHLEAGTKITIKVVNSNPAGFAGNDLYSYTSHTYVDTGHFGVGSRSTTYSAPDNGLYDSIYAGINPSLTTSATIHFTAEHVDNCNHFFAHDGRVNPYDAQQSVTAYCTGDGGLAVWSVIESQGTKLFTVSKKQIGDALASAKSSGKPVLIGQKAGRQLWALPSHELQLVEASGTPGAYYFVFAGSFCG